MDEYNLQAIEFLKKSGTSMKISRDKIVLGFPNCVDDHRTRWKYKVKMKRNGKQISLPFYDSVYNYEKNILPTSYDVLAALEKYEITNNMWQFASEFGFEIKDEGSFNRVKNIWKAARKEYKKISEFFGEFMQDLQEIV